MHVQTPTYICAHMQIRKDIFGKDLVKILLYSVSMAQCLQMLTQFHVADCMAFVGSLVCRRKVEAGSGV